MRDRDWISSATEQEAVVGYQLLMGNGKWTKVLYPPGEAMVAVENSSNTIVAMRPLYAHPTPDAVTALREIADITKRASLPITHQINEIARTALSQTKEADHG